MKLAEVLNSAGRPEEAYGAVERARTHQRDRAGRRPAEPRYQPRYLRSWNAMVDEFTTLSTRINLVNIRIVCPMATR